MKKSVKPLIAITLAGMLLFSTYVISFAGDDYEPLGACAKSIYELVQTE